ncbi:dipeptidyl-peptidase [Aureococcus anophagefferens]|nr:dipeptidyl-peptidase [Aureococcus anophagefferens]
MTTTARSVLENPALTDARVPDRVWASELFDSLKKNDHQRTLSTYAEARSARARLNVHCYNGILHVLADRGLNGECEEVVADMRRNASASRRATRRSRGATSPPGPSTTRWPSSRRASRTRRRSCGPTRRSSRFCAADSVARLMGGHGRGGVAPTDDLYVALLEALARQRRRGLRGLPAGAAPAAGLSAPHLKRVSAALRSLPGATCEATTVDDDGACRVSGRTLPTGGLGAAARSSAAVARRRQRVGRAPELAPLELEDSELAAIKAWAERALCVVPRGCHDDLYWMLATVSRDQPSP